ncbi:MAG: CaiB/BaiF CoA transferase family protein, partial [Sphingomonas sp.]
MTGPLAGLLVVDMAQFLSGPSAALRLADLGARVVKVERPGSGDICRTLYLSDTDVAGDSTLFHAINRNKESLAADLKDPADAAVVRRLIARADVVIQNFRPGVAERLGFGPDQLRATHPRLIVGSISGYGPDGPWAGLPGQDLLAQAMSGAMWLSGDRDDGPVPFGLSIADMLAGHILVEGILATLVRRGITGEGAHVETSLLEALVDLQFEVLTTYLNDGGRPPLRAAVNNAHAYLAAPYGVYRTADGWLALAMTPLPVLADLIDLPIADADGFVERDAVKAAIAQRLATRSTADWLAVLTPAD